MAACRIEYNTLNNTYTVLDETGNESKLYQDLLANNVPDAINVYQVALNEKFKAKEPTFNEFMAYMYKINYPELQKFNDILFGKTYASGAYKNIKNLIAREFPRLKNFIVLQPFNKEGSNVIKPVLNLPSNYFLQTVNETKDTLEKENKELNSKLTEFLSSVGVSMDFVENHPIYSKMNVRGVADLIQKVVYTSLNKSNLNTLPEEASHILIEILKQQNSPLYTSMLQDVEKYEEYAEVLENYKDLGYTALQYKEEALGKIISKRLVNGFANDTYKESRVLNWFDKVLDFIKNLVNKQGFNTEKQVEDYFDIAAKQILNSKTLPQLQASNEVLYQVDDEVKNIIAKLKQRTTEIRTIDSGKEDSIKEVNKNGVWSYIERVSEKVKKQTYNLIRTEAQQKEDTLKKEFGTKVHNDLQFRLLERLGKPTTGLNLIFANSTRITSQINSFLDKLLTEFPETNFEYFTELNIHGIVEGKSLGGTVDVLMVDKATGQVHLIDYKNVTNLLDKGIQTSKKKSWQVQLDEYGKILKDYGITSVGINRMLPIHIEFNSKVQGGEFNLASFTIGNLTKKSNINAIPSINERYNLSPAVVNVINELIERRKKAIANNDYLEVASLKEEIEALQLNNNLRTTALRAAQDKNYASTLIAKDTLTADELLELTQLRDYYSNKFIKNEVKDADGEYVLEIVGASQFFQDNFEAIKNKIVANNKTLDFDDTYNKPYSWFDKLVNLSLRDNPAFKAFSRLVQRINGEKENKVALLKEKVAKLIPQIIAQTGKKDESAYYSLYQRGKKGELTPVLVNIRNKEWYKLFEENKTKLYNFKDSTDISYLPQTAIGEFLNFAKFKADYDAEIKKTEIKNSSDNITDEQKEEEFRKVKRFMLNKITPHSDYIDITSTKFQNKYYTEEYKGLTGALKEMYHLMLDLNNFAHKNCDTNIRNTNIPYVRKQLASSIIKSPVATYKSIVDSFNLNTWETTETDINGNPIYKIPLKFNTDIYNRDLNLQSYDMGELLLTWADSVYTNDLQQKAHSTALLFLDQLKNSKEFIYKNGELLFETGTSTLKLKEVDSATIEDFEDYLHNIFYGQKYTDNKANFLSGKQKKIVEATLKVTSAANIGLNVFSALSNITGGMVNALAYTGKHYDKLDLVKAIKNVTTRDTKSYAFMNMFDIDANIYDVNKFKSFSLNKSENIFKFENLYALQRIGDFGMQNSILLAMAKKYTIKDKKIVLKENDAEISLFDNLELKNDTYVFADLPINELTAFREKVKSVSSTIIGNSSETDKTLANTTFVGQILMQYRRWMLPLGADRFSKVKYNSALEEIQVGKYLATYQVILNAYKNKGLKDLIGFVRNTKSGTIDDYLAERFKKEILINPSLKEVGFEKFKALFQQRLLSSFYEGILIASLLLLKTALDDDDEKNAGEKILYRSVSRTLQEATFWINFDNFSKLTENPVPLINSIGDLVEIFTNPVHNWLNDKDVFEKEGTKIGKVIPISSAYFKLITELDKD